MSGSRKNQTGDYGKHKTYNMTISIYPGDKKLVEELVEFFGSSQSDVIRSAIRAFAHTIVQNERRK